MSGYPAQNPASNIFFTIVGILIAGIPTELLVLLHYLVEPQGFWQNIFLFGFGFYFLGGIQIGLFIGLLVWLCVIWNE